MKLTLLLLLVCEIAGSVPSENLKRDGNISSKTAGQAQKLQEGAMTANNNHHNQQARSSYQYTNEEHKSEDLTSSVNAEANSGTKEMTDSSSIEYDPNMPLKSGAIRTRSTLRDLYNALMKAKDFYTVADILEIIFTYFEYKGAGRMIGAIGNFLLEMVPSLIAGGPVPGILSGLWGLIKWWLGDYILALIQSYGSSYLLA